MRGAIILFLAIFITVSVGGCAPMILNIKDIPPDTVELNVDSIQISDNAEIEPWRNSPYSSAPNPLPETIQKQFHEAVLNTLEHTVIANNSLNNPTGKKALVRIDRSVVTFTNQGVKSVVFIGFLFLGMEEEYTAIIDGIIEIEDSGKRVIDKTDLHVKVTIKGNTATGKQVEEGTNKVINDALIALQKEVIEKSNRYLYKYLKGEPIRG